LRPWVEGADAVDLVAEEVDPNRILGARRKEIEDAAPAGDRARLLDQRRHLVAEIHRPVQQPPNVEPLANAENPGPCRQFGGIHDELGQAVDRRDDDRSVLLAVAGPA
jgi:hypothetical protein